MITHTTGESSPNIASEVLMGLDELQARVTEAGSLLDIISGSHQNAVIIVGDGEFHVRGYNCPSAATILSGETLLAGITEGTLSLPVASREFRRDKTGLDAVEELRNYWVDLLSGKDEANAAYLLSWGLMPTTTEFKSLGLRPLRLLDSIYQVFQYEHMSLRVMARRKGFLDMLEKALTEVCRPLFTEELSDNELNAFAGHLVLDSWLEARGVTELVDMLATERPLSPELQDARRELARIGLLEEVDA